MLSIAYAALLLVIPFAAILFGTLRPQHATAVLMLGAMLFLPERIGFDAPGLPSIDKSSLPPLVVLVALSLTARRRLALALRLHRSDWLLLLLVTGGLATSLSNFDPVRCGSLTIPGMDTWDALSETVPTILGVVAPYLIGRAQIQHARDPRDFFEILVGAYIIYLPLIYFELRMSPQLHYMVYGIQQHSFIQTIRFGGYRPMVFMPHGLALAMFSFSGIIMAWALARTGSRALGSFAVPVACVLSITHVLLKSSAAIVYAVLAFPLVFFTGRRTASAVALVMCATVLTYPLLRAADAFPTATILEGVRRVSYERAQSLDFRFRNEDVLLERARLRPWLGWGSWGRPRVCDADGRDLAVTDGAWIITLGNRGAVGLLAIFGVLVSASLTGLRALGRLRRLDGVLLCALTWIQIFFVVDLIPNASGFTLALYLSGCLVGFSDMLQRQNTRRTVDPGRTHQRWSTFDHLRSRVERGSPA